ncbi:hypothetical protein V6N11_010516 [Hibiscus sabdariffa]
MLSSNNADVSKVNPKIATDGILDTSLSTGLIGQPPENKGEPFMALDWSVSNPVIDTSMDNSIGVGSNIQTHTVDVVDHVNLPTDVNMEGDNGCDWNDLKDDDVIMVVDLGVLVENRKVSFKDWRIRLLSIFWAALSNIRRRILDLCGNLRYVGGTPPSTLTGLGRFATLAIDDGSRDAVRSSTGENQEIRSGVDKNTLPAPNLTSFHVGELRNNCKVRGTTGRVGNGAEGLTTTLPAKELGSVTVLLDSNKNIVVKVVDRCRLDDFLPLIERKEGGKKLTSPFRVQHLSKVKGDAR